MIPVRHAAALLLAVLLPQCGGALPDDPAPPVTASGTASGAEQSSGREAIQQGIALTYIETTGNANMDMQLDMADAQLAISRVLGLVPASQVSPLALTRSNNFELGIDDVLFLAQKVNGVRTGLQGPSPLLWSEGYAAEIFGCGFSDSAGFFLHSNSIDAAYLEGWRGRDDGECSTACGDFPFIGYVNAGCWLNTTYTEYCLCASPHPACMRMPVYNSEGVRVASIIIEVWISWIPS